MVNGPAATVRPVLPLTDPRVAEIVVVPVETAVARPPVVTVATAVVDDAKVTWFVTSSVLVSEYVAVAVNCCVPPVVTVALAGVTAIEFSVGGGCGLNTTSTQ